MIPDAPPEVVLAAVAKEPENGRDHSTWSLIHNRFNGRAYDTLRHLITCGTGVTRDWHRALRHLPRSPCLSCLQSRAEKIPSRAHVPPALVPGYISYDIFEMGIPHLHGGQKYVIGFHDSYSRLNKVYLLHNKSQAPCAIDKFHAWARSHNVQILRLHADNANELSGKALTEKWAARGIRITACAPYEPRGNGKMERQWRTMGADTRHALAVSGLPAAMWWYMMRATVRVSWSIPINAAESPWSRFTGRPSSPYLRRTTTACSDAWHSTVIANLFPRPTCGQREP